MTTGNNQTILKNKIAKAYQQAINDGTIINSYLDDSLFQSYFLLHEEIAPFEHIPLNKKKPSRIQRLQTKKEFDNYSHVLQEFNKLKQSLQSLGEDYFNNNNESETIDKIIIPVLKILGFNFKAQESRTVNDLQHRPDFILFASEQDFKQYNENETSLNSDKIIILEAKSFNENIHIKNKKDTPHKQMLDYLNAFNSSKGILTNGREWLIYNTKNPRKNTPIVGMNLWRILFNTPTPQDGSNALFSDNSNNDIITATENKYSSQNSLSVLNFYYLFTAENFDSSFFDKLEIANNQKTEELTNNLKEALYGEDSILETVGIAIYNQNKQASVEEIYHNALVVIFRLIFMLFYENKYQNYLKNHNAYHIYSIYELYKNLKQNVNKENQNNHTEYDKLITIWQNLDKGNTGFNIPMLNGGLFSQTEAPLINNYQLFNNQEILQLLDNLVDNKDYKNLTVEKLGNIYEGLLSYEFKIAVDEIFLVKYYEKNTKAKNQEIYTFADGYSLKTLQKEHNNLIVVKTYKASSLYLTSYSNQRKTTASYYTPQVLSEFMVKDAIDYQLQQGTSILDLKIIDNACGSGHFLVEALNYLSEICDPYASNSYYSQIAQEIAQEQEEIVANINNLVKNPEEAKNLYPEIGQIIKRFLLKKLIYGVDLNKIAVEITKISLWIETFIFGTPLSFIEHHIKCGNSLLYSNIADFINFENEILSNDLFKAQTINMAMLQSAYQQINQLNDNNKENIQQSKAIYGEIAQNMQTINLYLNFLNYYQFKVANKINIDVIKCFEILIAHYINGDANHITPAVASKNAEVENTAVTNATKNATVKNSKVTTPIKKSQKNKINFDTEDFLADFESFIKNYNPFNVQVEFPDAFNHAQQVSLFNVIIGNPPWEINKFNENDFFSQYHSNYRSLSHGQKEIVRERLYANFNLKALYQQQQTFIYTINNYYTAKYPHNSGAGNSNLYQFFMERNLSLLAPKGTLYYITPSLWSFADSGLKLRAYILNSFNLTKLFCFENKLGLFDIHRSYKFAIYQINNGNPTNNFNCFFMQHAPARLYEPNSHINLSLKEIKQYSPTELAIIELNSPLDKQIVFKAYKKFNTFNDSYVKFNQELNMTIHKNLMQENIQEGLIPMYEGKLINQFNSSVNKFTYFVNPKALPKKNPKIKNTPNITTYNQGINKIKFYKNYHQHIRLAFRDIASKDIHHTFIASLLPTNSTAGNSLNVSVPSNHASLKRLLFCCGFFNSVIAEFIIRLYITLHVNLTYLKKLPMPMPSDSEIEENASYSKLVHNSAQLTYLYNPTAFANFKELFNLQTQNYPKTEVAQQRYREEIQVENDCIILQLYNITTEELKHMLNSFKVLQKQQPQYIDLLLKKYNP